MTMTFNQLLALAYLATTLGAACAARLPEPQASEMKCVEKFSTRVEIDDCRARVRAQWALTLDGGKP